MRLFSLIFFLGLIYSESVFACCASPTAPMKERAEKSALIFVGEIISIMKVGKDPYKRIASVKVNRSIKGAEGLGLVDVHFNIASEITNRDVSEWAKITSAAICGTIDGNVVKLEVSQGKKTEWLFFVEDKEGALFTSEYWGTERVYENSWEMKELQKFFPERFAAK